MSLEAGVCHCLNAFRYFQVMSNELSNPLILFARLTRSEHPPRISGQISMAATSVYFIGLDADDKFAGRFLTGDSNITNGMALRDGCLLELGSKPTRWLDQ